MENKPTTKEVALIVDEATEILDAFRLLSKSDKFKILYMIKGAILTSEKLITD